jgi:hypothetical protein
MTMVNKKGEAPVGHSGAFLLPNKGGQQMKSRRKLFTCHSYIIALIDYIYLVE